MHNAHDEMQDKTEYNKGTILDNLATYSKEHEELVRLFRDGKNLLITGQAGTGKTEATKTLITCCRMPLVCGPTGMSAILLGGKTIHQLLFLAKDDQDVNDIAKTQKNNVRQYKNLKKTLSLERFMSIKQIYEADVIFIDECSMVSAWLIDVMDISLRILREKDDIFGGLQVIFIGDFLQLAPVPTTEISNKVKNHRKEQVQSDLEKTTHYAFQSFEWQELNISTCKLTKVFRQDDKSFSDLLLKIATEQKLTINEHIRLDNKLKRAPPNDPTQVELMYAKKLVKQRNQIRYEQTLKDGTMREELFTFPLSSVRKDTYPSDFDHLCKNVKDLLQVNDMQRFCIGARVMMRVNLPKLNLVNGHIGTVVDFSPENDPIVKFDHNVEEIILPFTFQITRYESNDDAEDGECKKVKEIISTSITAIPLMLCWAITVHKSQGQTFRDTRIVIDCNGFHNNMLYVALSRAADLDQIILLRYDGPMAPKNRAAINFYFQRAYEQTFSSSDIDTERSRKTELVKPLPQKFMWERDSLEATRLEALKQYMQDGKNENETFFRETIVPQMLETISENDIFLKILKFIGLKPLHTNAQLGQNLYADIEKQLTEPWKHIPTAKRSNGFRSSLPAIKKTKKQPELTGSFKTP